LDNAQELAHMAEQERVLLFGHFDLAKAWDLVRG
jgi:uncharacterized protein (UPF0303 family)